MSFDCQTCYENDKRVAHRVILLFDTRWFFFVLIGSALEQIPTFIRTRRRNSTRLWQTWWRDAQTRIVTRVFACRLFSKQAGHMYPILFFVCKPKYLLKKTVCVFFSKINSIYINLKSGVQYWITRYTVMHE